MRISSLSLVSAWLVGLICLGGVSLSAEIKVSGAGWWTDRALQRSLEELGSINESETVSANAVEDAVFFVMSAVADDGFLRPEVLATIERESGEVITHRFDVSFLDLLPRPLLGRTVSLEVKPGVRYQFGKMQISGGGEVISAELVRKLLIPRTGLLARTADTVFTPAKLRKGLERVQLRLDRAGYAGNTVRVSDERQNHETGSVDIDLSVEPGERWRIGAVQIEGGAGLEIPRFSVDELVGKTWTASIEQDLVERFRRTYYKAGYPDVRFTTKQEFTDGEDGERSVIVVVGIEAGAKVLMSAPEFTGTDRVKSRVLSRRVELRADDVLNPLEVEEARRRLQRLRALRRVGIRYEPKSGGRRTPVFDLEAREPWEVSLLGGFGSYEKVRGGVEVKGNNLFRRSHQLRVEGIASVKSLRGEMVYTVPELFGEAIDGNVRLFGLDREEFSFQRREYGGSVGLSRRNLPWVHAEGIANYTFQELANGQNELATRQTDLDTTSTASLTLGLRRDKRDNPLLPRKGQRWTAQVELADQGLGGDAAFQRIELGWSWHKPLNDSSWIHVGFGHGTILTLGETNDAELPVNKRFFPGGENSYRGLQSGEAATRDGTGEFVGAKSFTLLNFEYELALTQRISAVAFWDALGVTSKIAEFPWEDTLHAIGLGGRYNTVIGPVRLEYGHNLNPRAEDPNGTLHFSIGYPF